MNGTISPVVDVTIGGRTRAYHAFITTAPVTLDGPSTLTLYESNFADVAGFAANPIPFERKRYREGQYLVASTDPILVGRNELEHWLWHRLAAPSNGEVH